MDRFAKGDGVGQPDKLSSSRRAEVQSDKTKIIYLGGRYSFLYSQSLQLNISGENAASFNAITSPLTIKLL